MARYDTILYALQHAPRAAGRPRRPARRGGRVLGPGESKLLTSTAVWKDFFHTVPASPYNN